MRAQEDGRRRGRVPVAHCKQRAHQDLQGDRRLVHHRNDAWCFRSLGRKRSQWRNGRQRAARTFKLRHGAAALPWRFAQRSKQPKYPWRGSVQGSHRCPWLPEPFELHSGWRTRLRHPLQLEIHRALTKPLPRHRQLEHGRQRNAGSARDPLLPGWRQHQPSELFGRLSHRQHGFRKRCGLCPVAGQHRRWNLVERGHHHSLEQRLSRSEQRYRRHAVQSHQPGMADLAAGVAPIPRQLGLDLQRHDPRKQLHPASIRP